MTDTEAEALATEDDWESGDAAPEAPPAATAAAVEDALPEHRYLNRELSWLDFNARVLALAADTSLPLLERAKFLAIFASNLDEFYMVPRRRGSSAATRWDCRCAPPTGCLRASSCAASPSATGRSRCATPRCSLDSVRPALAAEGIVIVTWADLTEAERTQLSAYFHEQVFPVLTPWPWIRRTRSRSSAA